MRTNASEHGLPATDHNHLQLVARPYRGSYFGKQTSDRCSSVQRHRAVCAASAFVVTVANGQDADPGPLLESHAGVKTRLTLEKCTLCIRSELLQGSETLSKRHFVSEA